MGDSELMAESICLNCQHFLAGWGKTKKKPSQNKRKELAQGRCSLDGKPTGVNWSCGRFSKKTSELESSA